MTANTKQGHFILYLLVFLSGSAGLIYQVTWHRYLSILLGAQALATAIVLAIFLGGISVGYWCFGQWSRWKNWNLLFVYCVVEVCLGMWAMLFPHLFHLAHYLAPKLFLSFGLNNIVIDVIFSLFLIGPPTFLMGGTLPLLTQSLSEDFKSASKTHARIYGYNTVGACFGCLLAGYVLIPEYGLVVALIVGSFLNVSIGLIVYFLFAKWVSPQQVAFETLNDEIKKTPTYRQLIILIVGFLSGFYVLSLENLLIRLMGLSTGSSNYNFTLIVSIFILGLGIGSILVKKIGDYKISQLFWTQLIVSAGIIGIYISGDYWSYGVHLLRTTLRDIPQNFYFYQFLLALGFTLLLIIPIGFCGIILPLCFHTIKDSRESLGLRVGQLYGLNTLGCVLGAFVGGYLLFYYFNLDTLIKFCASLSLISTLLLGVLYYIEIKPSRKSLAFSSALLLLLLSTLIFTPFYHPEKFIQPFRHSQPIANVTYKGAKAFEKYLSRNTKIIFWKDDPNTSVGIGATVYDGKELSRTILINGKSDGNTRGDFLTTILLAHIPMLLSPNPKNVCIIGFGTGITIGTVSIYKEVEKIDVAEISPSLIKHAYYFDKYNRNVSLNSKVKFHEMDAFRFLAGTATKYDVIISEPSNPWVAGIENLYAEEFYSIAKEKLTNNGIYAQWIHTYSFNNELFTMVLRTMSSQFKYISVFQLKGGDLLLLAKNSPYDEKDINTAINRYSNNTEVINALKEVKIENLDTIFALEIVPAKTSEAIGEAGKLHTLESPKLSYNAAKAFFTGSSANVLDLRRNARHFFGNIDSSLLSFLWKVRPVTEQVLTSMLKSLCEEEKTSVKTLCEELLVGIKTKYPQFAINANYTQRFEERDLASLSLLSNSKLKKFNIKRLREINTALDTYKKYASPINQLTTDNLLTQLNFCMNTTAYSDELYGECLLQKIILIETTTSKNQELQSNIQQYLEWFPHLDKNNPNYEKLSKAKEILEEMRRKRKDL